MSKYNKEKYDLALRLENPKNKRYVISGKSEGISFETVGSDSKRIAISKFNMLLKAIEHGHNNSFIRLYDRKTKVSKIITIHKNNFLSFSISVKEGEVNENKN